MDYLAARFAGAPPVSDCKAPPAPPPHALPLLAPTLVGKTLRRDWRGEVALRVHNPNPFTVTLTAISVAAERWRVRRTGPITIGAHRTRAIRVRLSRVGLVRCRSRRMPRMAARPRPARE